MALLQEKDLAAAYHEKLELSSCSCQIICAGMPNWPSSISCQADLPAWEQATQLRVLIIKSTEYLTHALSCESLALTSQVQSSFRSKRTRLKHELMSAQWEEKSLHAAESSIRSTLQPLTANTPWQWWSETPIVLRIAKNTRCVTQWLLHLVASQLKSVFQ